MSLQPQTKRWLALGLAFAFAWALFLATAGRVIGVGALKPPDLVETPLAGSTDFDWTLKDLAGNPVKLSDYKGRPMILNIWATWCVPCLDEMPSLSKLAENPRIKEKGVAILCVTNEESPAKLQEFLKDRSWKMTMLLARSSPLVFQTDTIPATYLIAPDGRIASIQVGAAQWDDVSVVEFLEKLK